MTQLLTSREIAIRLRLTPDDLQVAVEAGEIPFVTVAGEVRFDPVDVLKELKRNSQAMENRSGHSSLADGC